MGWAERQAKYKKIRESDDLNGALMCVLNYFEEIAQSIEFKIADAEYLKHFFEGIFVTYHHCFSDFITEKRRQMRYEDLFCKFEALAKRWGARTANSSKP